MLLAELDANGWVLIIGAIGIVVMQIVTAVLAYKRDQDKIRKLDQVATMTAKVAGVAATRTARVAAKLEENTVAVAAKLEEDTAATVAKIDENTAITRTVHMLVNNAMGVALKSIAELSRWKAEQTGTQADLHAAELAERALKDHVEKQAVVDGKE